MFNDKMPYTEKMLATVFRMNESTVSLAIQTFEQFGMVEIVDGVITIPNWGKHQNLDKIESKNEYMRDYMRDYRAKQKLLTECKTNSKANVSSVEEDKERELDNRIRRENIYQQIADLYNEICISFPKVVSLSESRKKAIKARLNTYNVEQFKEMFTKAESSAFLKGKNKRDWQANFDWMLKDANFTKILEGNYDDAKPAEIKTDASYDISEFRKRSLHGELKYERKKK